VTTPIIEAPLASLLDHGRRRRRRRGVVVTAVLGALAFALFVLTLMVGSYVIAPWDVIASTLHLSANPAVDFIVRDLRLPIATTAFAVGVALGVSGLVFQTLLANPLASPDFVGVSSGASLFAIASIVLFSSSGIGIPAAALVGAMVSAALIYVLAWRHGITGYRFILIGIAVSQFMYSIVGYIIARADIYEARQAMTWLVGSVGQAGPTELRVLLVGVVVLVPLALLLDRPLRVLELGDDAAKALGARVELTRLALLAISVTLIAFATAVAGPIMFVALIAGPIARRLFGSAPGGLLAAGFAGAVIVLSADLVAQHVVPVALPTGVISGAVGAPYLIWLLITVNREGRGG
jgi:iron complex transport system permease protein